MAGICNVHPWPANESQNGCLECLVEVCDFCRGTPGWLYLAEEFTSRLVGIKADGTRMTYTQVNSPEWAACNACHDLIEAKDVAALAERAVKADWDGTGRPKKMREELKRDLMRFHGEFMRRRIGPAKRLLVQ
jgi:hypothetical protein